MFSSNNGTYIFFLLFDSINFSFRLEVDDNHKITKEQQLKIEFSSCLINDNIKPDGFIFMRRLSYNINDNCLCQIMKKHD